jgi:hypothetical protein
LNNALNNSLAEMSFFGVMAIRVQESIDSKHAIARPLLPNHSASDITSVVEKPQQAAAVSSRHDPLRL